jgi:uncharacterized protein
MQRIGIISDTLGLLRPEALAFLRGSDYIGPWAETIDVLHDLAQLDLDPAAAGYQVVVSGHSHKPSMERCELKVTGGAVEGRLVELAISR